MDQTARARHLVTTYADQILRLCYSYLRSHPDAEDVTQDVLLRALQHNKTFTSPAHEKAWLLRTAIHRCTDVLRSVSRQRTDYGEGAQSHLHVVPDPAPAVEDQVLDIATPLAAAIRQLTPEHRVAVHLYYYEGYSAREIADLTGDSANTIHQRLSRARTQLRVRLEGERSHA